MANTAINREERLGKEPMLKLFFKMAIPNLIAQFINLLYAIVDRIFIGHIPNVGVDALAGIGVTTSIIIFITAFATIVGMGGSSLAAIELGKGEKDKAHKILGNGFLILIFFTVALLTPCYIFMKPILLSVGASQATLPYAIDYLSIYLIGTLAVLITNGLNTFITIQGRPNIAMTAIIIGAVLNIILDYIFIFPCGLGIKGAALATIISQIVSALFILWFLCGKSASLKLDRAFIKTDKKIILSTLALGVAPFIMHSTEALVGFVLNGTLKEYGDIHVSAITIIQSALLLASVPITGFAQGLSPIVSYNYGAKNLSRVKECFKISFCVITTTNFITILLMILIPSAIASTFTTDTQLIELVSKMAPIFLTGMLLFGMQRTCQSMFVALGEAKISIFIAILRKLILLIPLALLLPLKFDVIGVYLAESISDATAAIICLIIFITYFPKILKRVQE